MYLCFAIIVDYYDIAKKREKQQKLFTRTGVCVWFLVKYNSKEKNKIIKKTINYSIN